MKNLLEALILGALLFTATAYPGTGDGGPTGRSKDGGQSLRIGLGVRVDADWISLNGTWAVEGAGGAGADGVARSSGETHEVRIGAVPNVVSKARTGYVVIKALRRATFCAAKHWYAELAGSDESAEG